MTTDITKRVARGVEWLDRHAPGWEKRVELREFDIENECRCVLGQVFGTFDSTLKGPDNPAGVISYRHAVACGFDVPASSNSYEAERYAYTQLQREWERVIRERKGALPSPKASTPQKEAR